MRALVGKCFYFGRLFVPLDALTIGLPPGVVKIPNSKKRPARASIQSRLKPLRTQEGARSMAHQTITTPAAPAAIGPYSQAVRAGDTTYCSGQIALDPVSGELVGVGDVGEQTRQVMKNLLAVVEAAGHPVTDIVRCTIFLADMNDFGVVNGVYAEALGGHRPARATVEVSRLPKDVRVEIDAIAVAAS